MSQLVANKTKIKGVRKIRNFSLKLGSTAGDFLFQLVLGVGTLLHVSAALHLSHGEILCGRCSTIISERNTKIGVEV